MTYNLKADIEEQGRLWEEANSLMQNAKNEKRELTTEENTTFDALIAKHQEKESSIARKQKLNDLEKTSVDNIEEKASKFFTSVDEQTQRALESRGALNTYLRKGMAGLSSKEMDIMKRAQSSGTDSEGGYTVDEIISNEIVKSLKLYGGMRQVATIIQTSTGGVLNYPKNDDTANVGEWLAENSAASAQDTVFGNMALNAWKASSDYMLLSRDLVQDSKFDIVAYISELIAERIGRLTNTAYTAGDGSSKPLGVRGSSLIGKAAAAATATTFAELLDLKHSVDPAYRANAHFMFNDNTLVALKKVAIASANQSLWQAGVVGGEPATIDGDKYIINNDLPNMAAGAHAILYGDFKKYIIRDVTGVEILQSEHLNMLSNQITYVGFMRTDGDLSNTSAIKHMRMSNT